MEPPKSALSQSIAIDHKKIIARQQSIQIAYMLRDFIPQACFSEAIYHLNDVFYREEVEITTKTTREINHVP